MTKGEIVAAKLRLFAVAQWIQILISVPFALLRHAVGIGNNPVGIDPVISWYGFGFIPVSYTHLDVYKRQFL